MIFSKISLITIITVTGGIISGVFGTNDKINSYSNIADLDKSTVVSAPQNMEEYIKPEQHNLDILFYDISLELFPENDSISGSIVIEAVYFGTEDYIILNFRDFLNISSVQQDEIELDYLLSDKHLKIQDGNFSDTFKVKIEYNGKPQSFGFGSFEFDSVDAGYFIYTLNAPNFASGWFPCNDKPDDKANFRLSITTDSSNTTVSNGNLISESIKEIKTTTIWETVYPISTYLICFYSAPYSFYADSYMSVSGKEIPLYYYTLPDKFENSRIDFAIDKRGLQVFEELFGEYPFQNEKYGVAEFLWNGGAMEHQTITGMGSRFITGAALFKDIYIHELAHSWWGNAVGPKTFKDVWLNEGFATYSEALFKENVYGQKDLQSAMLQSFNEFERSTLYDPWMVYSRLVYDKGAWVLHMLRYEIGSENFFILLQNYYKKFRFKSASTEDFKLLAEEISGKNLDKFFNQWIYKGKGIIDAQYSVEFAETTSINIRQVQKLYDVYEFPLQIELKSGNTKIIFDYYITTSDTVLIVDCGFVPNSITFDPNTRLLADFTELQN